MSKVIIIRNKWEYFLITILFIVLFTLSAFRDGVGTDYKNYESLFYGYISVGDAAIERLEPGFKIIFELVSFFTSEPRLFFIITSFLILSFFFLGFFKYSRSILLSIFLFISLYYYFNSLNTIRQFVGMSIVFYVSTRYLVDRKLYKYVLSVIFASLFHLSALIVIPAYWLCKEISFRTVLILLFCLPVVLLSYDFFASFIFKIFPSYAIYSDYQTGSSSVFLAIQMAFFIIIFMVYKNNKIWTKVELISFNFSLISLFLYVLSYKNIIFFRVGIYFGMYLLILVPAALNNFKSSVNKMIFYLACIFLGLINLSYHLYNNVSEVLPFRLIF